MYHTERLGDGIPTKRNAESAKAIANKEYGEFVDLIEVQSTQGQRYKTFVPINYFSRNEQVDFIAEKTTLTSIARIKRNAE